MSERASCIDRSNLEVGSGFEDKEYDNLVAFALLMAGDARGAAKAAAKAVHERPEFRSRWAVLAAAAAASKKSSEDVKYLVKRAREAPDTTDDPAIKAWVDGAAKYVSVM